MIDYDSLSSERGVGEPRHKLQADGNVLVETTAFDWFGICTGRTGGSGRWWWWLLGDLCPITMSLLEPGCLPPRLIRSCRPLSPRGTSLARDESIGADVKILPKQHESVDKGKRGHPPTPPRRALVREVRAGRKTHNLPRQQGRAQEGGVVNEIDAEPAVGLGRAQTDEPGKSGAASRGEDVGKGKSRSLIFRVQRQEGGWMTRRGGAG